MLTQETDETLLDWEREEDETMDFAPIIPNKSRRILVAEDDYEMCILLVDALRADGYDVIEAEDGRQLMDCIDALRGRVVRGRFFDVDLIISDIRMPGMSGLEMLAQLRSMDRQTPVILITAFGDEATHAKAYRLGAGAVFDKPFDIDGFRAFVRQLVPPDTDHLDGVQVE
jgi:DNA-binding response OmpR family regulator